MKITRQTETELVVVDSCLWLAGFFFLVSLIFVYAALSHAQPRLFVPAGVMFLFGVPWLRRSTFTFDAAQRIVRYRVLRYWKTSAGALPFADISGIGSETSSAPRGGTIYRLAILTRERSIPMSDAYSGGRTYHEDLRLRIQKFVMGEVVSAAAKEAAITAPGAREATVRSLLSQGRKIDAIQMLGNDEDLDLTEATQRVDAMEKGMATKSAASPQS